MRMFHHQETVNPVSEVAEYPAPVIYGIVHDSNNYYGGGLIGDLRHWVSSPRTRGQVGPLAEAFNTTNYGGVYAFWTTIDGENRFVVNGSVAQEAQSFSGEHIPYIHLLNSDQIKQARMPRRPLGRICRLGASMAATAAPTMELTAITSPVIGTAAGIAATGLTYLASIGLSKRSEFEEATSAWQNFKSWLTKPENGAISFPYVGYGSSFRSPGYGVTINEEQKLIARELGLEVNDSDQGENNISLAGRGSAVGRVIVNPIDLICSALRSSEDPADLWNSGLQEAARTMANAAEAIGSIDNQVKTAKYRHSFTGIDNPDELGELGLEKEQAGEALLVAAISMLQHSKKHKLNECIEKARERLGVMLDGDEQGSCKLPIHLRLMEAAAAEAISKLDTSTAPKNGEIELIRKIGEYIKETSRRLDDPKHFEEYYRGMCKQFGDQLPDGAFPDWDDVFKSLPVLSV